MRRLLRSVFRFWRETKLDVLPISKDILRYRSEYFLPDVFSGLNVALLVFPQAMVYALLAGLPVEYGLYGAIVATVISALFSGSSVLNLGPTNSTAVVMLSALPACGVPWERFPEVLPVVLVMTGAFLLIGACLNISSLVQYVSKSVILGYMTAVIIIMIINQVHTALGFDLHVVQDGTITSLDILKATIVGLQDIDGSSLFVCIIAIMLFFFWRKCFPKMPVIAMTIFSLALLSYFLMTFFGFSVQTLDNVYVSSWKATLNGFTMDNVNTFASTAFALSFVCLIDGTTILKALAARMGKRANINQMVFSVGIANMACGICSGMPASGSLVRSSANYISGARTCLASIFCGVFCLLGIICFGSFFKFVPKSGLAMVVILLGIGLFEKEALKIVLKSGSVDMCVFLVTFISSFIFPLNISIFLGILVSVALFLKRAAVPEFCEYTCEGDELFQTDMGSGDQQSELSIIHVEGNLFFASAELFLDQIREICQRPQLKVIILKLRNAFYIDGTCLLALKELLQYMGLHGRKLILSEVGPYALKTLKQSGLYDIIGGDNIFKDDPKALNQSTSDAMKKAREMIGHEDVVVRIIAKKEPETYGVRGRLKSLVAPLRRKFKDIRNATSK